MFNLNFIFMISFISNIIGVYGEKPKDCSSTVTSGIVSYNGCKEYVKTTSLEKPKDDVIPIHSFRGIPYAEPPVGPLRFRKTIPKTYSKPTTIDATHYRNPCLQPMIIDVPFPSQIPSENCLYLNVWTPKLDTSANLPVMFWIHGGGFFFGSGAEIFGETLDLGSIYDGSQLALRYVVVVTFNYRLGCFGFLYGNSSEAPGNVGLWDQAMALNWTKQNIQAFGGNPNSITLFGESAGSISVSHHIVSNVTRNWFHRAIMQSGSAYLKQFSRDKKYSYEMSRRFASNSTLFMTGNCDDDDWIECLRNKRAKELLLAESTAILWNPTVPWHSAWMQQFVPIYEDEFMPISVNKAVKIGDFKRDIKILIGHNEMEGAILTATFDILRGLMGRYLPILPIPIVPIFNKNTVFKDIKNIFINNDTFGSIVADKYTESFTNRSLILNQNLIRKAAVHAFGDFLLTCPTVLFGAYLSKNRLFTGKVFQYKLTYANTLSFSKLSVWAEATHLDDLPLVFGLPFRSFTNIFWLKGDKNLSKDIMNIWTHFARYDELPIVNGNVWPAYSLNADKSFNASYLELHANPKRMGKVYTNRYDGFDDGYDPPVIQNCFNFWDELMSEQF